jgi:hypothetical protein
MHWSVSSTYAHKLLTHTLAGYVEQFDTLIVNLTVEEMLMYT